MHSNAKNHRQDNNSTDIQMKNNINVPPCNVVFPSNYLDYWIPEISLDDMAKIDYDVIVVGTGAGGGAALWRLCQKWKNSNKRIGIIEAGGFLLPTHAQNIATFNAKRFMEYFLNPKISKHYGMSLPNFPGAADVIALGGKTLFWTCAAPRLYFEEFKDWPISIKELSDYYYIAEQVLSVSKIYSEQSTINQILLPRLIDNGFTEATTVPLATDLVATNYGQIHSNVFFSSNSFFGRALTNRPFDLAVNAPAVEVLTDKNKAVGVKVFSKEKKPYFIKSKAVVLSASTLQTPRILLNSEIQGRAIGHYLINHSFITGTAKIDLTNFSNIKGTVSLFLPQGSNRPYQIQIKGPDDYYWHHYRIQQPQRKFQFTLQGFGSVEPRFENKLFLNHNKLDEYGIPEFEIDFSYSEKDQHIINEMTKTLEQVTLAMEGELVSINNEPLICLQPPGIDYHDAGTCRMGNDPDTSVCDKYGKVHGISGLYVADKSVLPTVGGANPTLTVIALAIRTASHIAENSN